MRQLLLLRPLALLQPMTWLLPLPLNWPAAAVVADNG
jgi:hypothetical protein